MVQTGCVNHFKYLTYSFLVLNQSPLLKKESIIKQKLSMVEINEGLPIGLFAQVAVYCFSPTQRNYWSDSFAISAKIILSYRYEQRLSVS
jgi:hypothetical protein